jgi:hypothetical protein
MYITDIETDHHIEANPIEPIPIKRKCLCFVLGYFDIMAIPIIAANKTTIMLNMPLSNSIASNSTISFLPPLIL